MKLTLNLASRSYVNERALKLGYLLLALLILLALMFQIRTLLQSRQQNLAYQSSINAIEEQLRGKVPAHLSVKQINAQKQVFNQAKALLKKDAFRWTALFDRMEGLLPRDVSIRSFNPDYRDGSLQLTGVAKQLPDLQALLNNLHADSFTQVYLTNQKKIDVISYDESKMPAIEFTIQLEGVF